MAKELNQLKKGTATFTLVGKAKISDYTFGIDKESSKEDSDWVYSKMNLGVDCGKKSGVIYADLQGGYGTDRDNVVYVNGKKEDGTDDYNNRFTIAWEDRDDEEILDTVGKGCFITTGLEKNEKDETVYKRFVTPYDAVGYISDNLSNGDIVKVKGKLTWKEYKGKIQVTKEVNYISLVDAKEEDFKAEFIQTILVDSKAIGKLDVETCTIPVDGYIVESLREYKDQKFTKIADGKKKNRSVMIPLFKTFDIQINKEEKEKAKNFLKMFKAKPKKVTQITVEGIFTRGEIETTEVDEKDIPQDILDLIDAGFITREEVIGKMAFVNGNNKQQPEKMVITKPRIKIKKGELPSVDRESDLYDEDDIDISLILESVDVELDIEEDDEVPFDEDKAVEEALKNETNDEGDDEDWLAGL